MSVDTTSTLNKVARIIGGGNANSNFGGSLTSSTSDGPRNGLLEFTTPNLSGTISKVTLYCYVGYNYGTTGNVYVHELSRTNWTQAGVTYNKYDGTNNWTTAGGDYNATAIEVTNVLGSASGWVSWDIMGGNADNPLTIGWNQTIELLMRTTTASVGFDWTATGANKPYLEITYTSGTNYTTERTETVTNTDTLVKSVTRSISETITNTDTFIKNTIRTVTESITNTDTFSCVMIFYKELSETVTSVDNIIRDIVRNISEAVTNNDVINKITARIVSETTTIADTITNMQVKLIILYENLTLIEDFRMFLNSRVARWRDKYNESKTQDWVEKQDL